MSTLRVTHHLGGTYVDETELDTLRALLSHELVDVAYHGAYTVLHFANGETLQLLGGDWAVTHVEPVLPTCGFCGATDVPLISPPHREHPCICPACVEAAVAAFTRQGVTLTLDVHLGHTTP